MFSYNKERNSFCFDGLYYSYYKSLGVFINTIQEVDRMQLYTDRSGKIKRLHRGGKTLIRIYDDKVYIAGKGIFHKVQNDFCKDGTLYCCLDNFFMQCIVIKNFDKEYSISFVAETVITKVRKEDGAQDVENLCIDHGFVYTKDNDYHNFSHKLTRVDSFKNNAGHNVYIYKNDKRHEGSIISALIIDDGKCFTIVDHFVNSIFLANRGIFL